MVQHQATGGVWSPDGGRLRSLDGLRALAIAAVVCLHLNWGSFLGGGQAGVTVFFVVSGYLITAGLIREKQRTGSVSLSGFYERRFYRLAPALALVLALGLVASLILTSLSVGLAAKPLDYLHTSALVLSQSLNIAVAGGHTVSYELMPTWSLAVEEQFYLVWAAVLVFALRRGALRVASAIAASALIASFAWSWWLADAGATKARVAYAPDTQMGALFVGAAVALLLSYPAASRFIALTRFRIVAGWAAGLGVLACLINHPFDLPLYRWGQVVLALATAVCVALLVTAGPHRESIGQRLLSIKPIVWIGTVSYGIYLFHVMIMQWLGGPGSLERGLLVVGLTALCAGLCYRYLEVPAMAWGTRRRKQRLADRARHLATSPATSPNDRMVADKSEVLVPANT